MSVRPPGFGPGSLALSPLQGGRPMDAMLCPRPGYPHLLVVLRRSDALDYGRASHFMDNLDLLDLRAASLHETWSEWKGEHLRVEMAPFASSSA